jgi:hypothetical protein
MVVLTIKEPIVWAVGLVFALAFLLQAVARRGEGNRLAAQYFRARDAEEIEGQLVAHSRELEMGKTDSLPHGSTPIGARSCFPCKATVREHRPRKAPGSKETQSACIGLPSDYKQPRGRAKYERASGDAGGPPRY